jgi:hypothetical protein
MVFDRMNRMFMAAFSDVVKFLEGHALSCPVSTGIRALFARLLERSVESRLSNRYNARMGCRS